MSLKLPTPKVGVLFITTPRFRNLGEDTPGGVYWQRKEREAQALLAGMDFAETVYPGVVYTREDLRAAMALFVQSGVDMVFAHFLSWSDDFAWVRFLRDMPPVPILFAAITRPEPGFEDSLNEDRFVEFLSAGGMVGALEASGSISRFDRGMLRRVVGDAAQVLEQLRQAARAAALRSQLRQSAVALLPSYNEVMWSTYVDPYDLFMRAGPELRFLSVAQLEDEMAAIPAGEVDKAVETLLSAYPSGEDIRKDKMAVSVQASMALEALARKHGAELLVLNDVDVTLLTHIGLRPGFTPCPGTDDVLVVPEGDIGGGLACLILKKLSDAVVNFVEPFHIDQRDGTFAAGHAGPGDYTDPAGKTVISTDTRFAKSGYKHAGAPFAWCCYAPGEKTMLHISQCNGRFKMVATVVDALPTQHFLAGYSHGVFRSRTPAHEFFQKLLDIGVTQHYAIAPGDYRQELRLAADLLDFDYSEL